MILPECVAYGTPAQNDYHYGQEWGYEEGKGSMWAPQVAEDAKASSLTSWRAASSQEPLVALQPPSAYYKLHVMLAWRNSVAL
jgi:hypothetical protein